MEISNSISTLSTSELPSSNELKKFFQARLSVHMKARLTGSSTATSSSTLDRLHQILTPEQKTVLDEGIDVILYQSALQAVHRILNHPSMTQQNMETKTSTNSNMITQQILLPCNNNHNPTSSNIHEETKMESMKRTEPAVGVHPQVIKSPGRNRQKKIRRKLMRRERKRAMAAIEQQQRQQQQHHQHRRMPPPPPPSHHHHPYHQQQQQHSLDPHDYYGPPPPPLLTSMIPPSTITWENRTHPFPTGVSSKQHFQSYPNSYGIRDYSRDREIWDGGGPYPSYPRGTSSIISSTRNSFDRAGADKEEDTSYYGPQSIPSRGEQHHHHQRYGQSSRDSFQDDVGGGGGSHSNNSTTSHSSTTSDHGHRTISTRRHSRRTSKRKSRRKSRRRSRSSSSSSDSSSSRSNSGTSNTPTDDTESVTTSSFTAAHHSSSTSGQRRHPKGKRSHRGESSYHNTKKKQARKEDK